MRILCAGCDDAGATRTVFAADHPYFLTSYYGSIRSQSKVEEWVALYRRTVRKGAWWMVDSGLFSMMFGAERHRVWSNRTLLDYAKQYADDLEGIGYVGAVVEMDVHKVLGMEALAKMRKMFEERFDPERTVYVWHLEETQAGWVELVKRYPYVAISIPELRKITQPGHIKQAVKTMIIRARDIRPDVKIHLLGCTQTGLMRQGGYFSCDSTSWMLGQKFLRGVIYLNGTLKACSVRDAVFKEHVRKFAPQFAARMSRLGHPHSAMTDAQRNYMFTNGTNVEQTHRFNRYINREFYGNEPIPTLWA